MNSNNHANTKSFYVITKAREITNRKALSLYKYIPTHPKITTLSSPIIKANNKRIETELPIQHLKYLQFLPPPKSFPLSKFQFWYRILFPNFSKVFGKVLFIFYLYFFFTFFVSFHFVLKQYKLFW